MLTHLAFLPGGTDMLVTELPGDLRLVRGGKLDPKPIPGWPADKLSARSLNSVVLHPDFARNRTLYFSYVKHRDGGDTTVALARGKFDGTKLTNVEEIFVADAWGTGATAGRAEFGPDGLLYLTVGDRDAGNVTITGVNRTVSGAITASGGAGLGTNQAGGKADPQPGPAP